MRGFKASAESEFIKKSRAADKYGDIRLKNFRDKKAPEKTNI